MTTKGVLLFAHNNQEIDYGLQAIICAKFVKKNLDVPVSVVTDRGTVDWLESKYPAYRDVFDQIIISIKPNDYSNRKRYYDGSLTYKVNDFWNFDRARAYEISPYDKTLVIDTDLLIVNDRLNSIWDTDEDFMISSCHKDLATDRDNFEFLRIADHGIKFVWATAFYFKKTLWTRTFFKLCSHIIENYEFYKFTYQIYYPVVRNDFVFSIALHMMQGFTNNFSPPDLPATIYYTLDKDELLDVRSDSDFLFLIQKKDCLGEYVPVKTSNQIVHIMNKYSLIRHADTLLKVVQDV